MGSTAFFLSLCAAIGACRLVELTISRRHQRALAATGAGALP
jgi:isoprenylcysteine carboxyl methyltransferase (ICMT) family protein YpbQ